MLIQPPTELLCGLGQLYETDLIKFSFYCSMEEQITIPQAISCWCVLGDHTKFQIEDVHHSKRQVNILTAKQASPIFI